MVCKMKQYILLKKPDGHIYILVYENGDERAAINAMLDWLDNPSLTIDWLDVIDMTMEIDKRMQHPYK